MSGAGRIAVFGDLSGHVAPLYKALESLGADVAVETLPADLTVVQVGDLVHKGPDGDEAVAFADRMMDANGGRWLQLLGNHESQYVGGLPFGHWQVAPETARILRNWVRKGVGLLAGALETEELGPTLVTHAGLTRELWLELGQPSDPTDAAVLLNRLLRADCLRAFAAGVMLQGGGGRKPGVVWAAAGSELYRSWDRHRAPFAQIHGHSSAWDWDRRSWRPWTPDAVVDRAHLDTSLRHLRVRIGGKDFVGIDPDWGPADPGVAMAPLVLTGTVEVGPQ